MVLRVRNLQITKTMAPGLADSLESLKWISLVVLTLQNASQVLIIRYIRTRPTKEMFLSTSAVFLTEIVKLITCIAIVSFQEKSFKSFLKMSYDLVVQQPLDTLRVCVPSLIYTVQNNLLYVAVSNLSATTFMVTYQLKILATAVCMVIMLRKHLTKVQWFALFILFSGVTVVQMQEQSGKTQPRASNGSSLDDVPKQNPVIGLVASIIAVLMSGFAAAYFEKILKGSDISVWMRNVQLAIFAIPISFITMYLKDGAIVRDHGILFGYDSWVWLTVVLYAVGGLSVAAVVKYADNILKGFATSVSIILSCVVSVYLFNFIPSLEFIFGTFLVMSAIYLYSNPNLLSTQSNESEVTLTSVPVLNQNAGLNHENSVSINIHNAAPVPLLTS